MSSLHFTINQAGADEISRHLEQCSPLFTPPLNEKVDIGVYAGKIRAYAITFEAWDQSVLAGLIAAYFNNKETGKAYITNVSTLPGYNGRGIGSTLMTNCIHYGKEQAYKEIELRVAKQNQRAINLYTKFGFSELLQENDESVMQRIL